LENGIRTEFPDPLQLVCPCMSMGSRSAMPSKVVFTVTLIVSGTRLAAYISRRPSMAFQMVTSSANSRSLPTGIPIAMRETLTPRGFSSLER